MTMKDGSNSISIGRLTGKEGWMQIVAKVIEFHIPDNFRYAVKWVSPAQRGKIIKFASQVSEPAENTPPRVALCLE